MSPPHGRPKEGSLPLGGKARSAKGAQQRVSMHHIRFLERGSLDANVRRPAFPHTWEEHGKIGADQIVPCLTGATIAIVNKTPLSAQTLKQLPSLAMIGVAATGTDNIDTAIVANAASSCPTFATTRCIRFRSTLSR
jgi:hypothetical protein